MEYSLILLSGVKGDPSSEMKVATPLKKKLVPNKNLLKDEALK